MDMHVFFTDQAVRSLDGLTAFSALPNAPVLPVKHRRRPLPRHPFGVPPSGCDSVPFRNRSRPRSPAIPASEILPPPGAIADRSLRFRLAPRGQEA